MQVVQPKPTTWKPNARNGSINPASSKYCGTTCDPGAKEVFTHGLVVSPRSAARFASNPAANITAGFEVLVQEVIAAITISP